jgi:hypothetical protein
VNDLVIESQLLGTQLPTPQGPVALRLRRLAGRWLATATGPQGRVEVGADASPYLAAQLALETWQLDTVTVLLAADRARPLDVAPEGTEPDLEPAAR